jgi:RNA polymerase sigma factor (TIGR02999 family)
MAKRTRLPHHSTMQRNELQTDLYAALHQQAARAMQHERREHTLSATALVHEAFLRLGNQFENEAHFRAAAAEAMRRVLVDAARARRRLKRGGNAARVELSDVPAPLDDDRLIALDEALAALALRDPLAARVVELHHFGGLAHDQTAALLNITVYEVRQRWRFSRAWLKTQLAELVEVDRVENSSTDPRPADA